MESKKIKTKSTLYVIVILIQGMSSTLAEYWMLKEVSTLKDYGTELFRARWIDNGTNCTVAVGPQGVNITSLENAQILRWDDKLQSSILRLILIYFITLLYAHKKKVFRFVPFRRRPITMSAFYSNIETTWAELNAQL